MHMEQNNIEDPIKKENDKKNENEELPVKDWWGDIFKK